MQVLNKWETAACLSWVAVSLFITGCSQAAKPGSDYQRASPQDTQWFRDARFGMFICWGPVTLTGKEIGWSRGGQRPGTGGKPGPTPVDVYDNLYKQWKPDRFDARAWVKIARDAGMKYIIFLVKHHDGYCLYDTRLTDYRSTSPEAAWQYDVMAEVADACHEANMRLFIYYSQPDWHHPDYLTEHHDRYIQYLHGQVRELLSRYGHIDGLWFDGLMARGEDRQDGRYAGADRWQAERLFQMARRLQPHILINNRCGLPGDFDTPEQKIGRFQTDRMWESCITLGTQWSWKPDDKIKSLAECINLLVRCAGGDGNLALNTNPMPNGQIESRQIDRFLEIGHWLRKYGESIYATRGGPFLPGDWGASTHRENVVYVHILKWEGDHLILPPLSGSVVSASLMTGGNVKVNQTAKGTEFTVAPADRREIDTIVVLRLDRPATMPAR